MGLKWPILSTDPPKLLSYDELPVRPDAPAGSSWSLWADGDVGGALNLLTPERVRKAAACIRTGQLFALDHDLDFPDPPVFSRRTALHHEVVSASGRAYDDVIDKFNTQSSTQWDGFRHYPHPDHGFYGGRRGDTHGVHHWASRGLAGRAVLVDIERWAAARNRPFQPGEPEPITADDLESCLSDQRIALETGDILLVRTGWLDWYRALPPERRAGAHRSGNADQRRPGAVRIHGRLALGPPRRRRSSRQPGARGVPAGARGTRVTPASPGSPRDPDR
jgi:hypothetical protein